MTKTSRTESWRFADLGSRLARVEALRRGTREDLDSQSRRIAQLQVELDVLRALTKYDIVDQSE